MKMYAITFTSIFIVLLSNVYAQSSSKYLRISPYGEPSYIYMSKILISCYYASVEEKPADSTLRWKFEDGTFIPSEYLTESDKSVTIKFAESKLKEGEYTCEYITKVNSENNVTDKLSINVKYAKEPTYENCKQTQYLIKNDTNALINCEVYTLPTASIEWRKNKVFLDKALTKDWYTITSKGIKFLKPVDDEIGGPYTISLNVYETGLFYSHDINVIVVDKPIINEIKSESPYLIDGKETKVYCIGEPNINPSPRYYWFAAKRNLSDPGNDNYQVNIDSGELIIKSGVQKDEGNFTCVALNDFGRDEKNIAIYYAAKPEFVEDLPTDKINEIQVMLDSTAKLQCEFKLSNLPLNLTIRKKLDNEVISSDNNRLMELVINKTDRHIVSATIIKTIKEDAGKYECIAESVGGIVRREITLNVLYEPVLRTDKSPVKIYGNMAAVNVTCEIDANPKAIVEWHLEGKPISEHSESDKRFKIYNGVNQDISILEVHRQPGVNVFYQYQCIAKNVIFGNSNTKTIFIKLEEAYAPSSVVASINEKGIKQRQLTLHVESANNGGLTIQGYTVKIIDNSDVKNERISDNHPANKNDEIVINDLLPNKTYHIQIAATNEVGTGDFGQELIVKTLPETVPDSPQFIIQPNNGGDIISEFNDEYTVSWSLPDDNGAPITFYEIKYYKVKRSDSNANEFEQVESYKQAAISGTDALTYRLDSLSANSYYKVEIYAKNSKGSSQTNSMVFRTSPGVGNSDNNIETQLSNSYSVVALVSIILVILLILAIIVDIVISINCGIGISHTLCPQLFNSSSMASKGDVVNIRSSSDDIDDKAMKKVEIDNPAFTDTKMHKDSAV